MNASPAPAINTAPPAPQPSAVPRQDPQSQDFGEVFHKTRAHQHSETKAAPAATAQSSAKLAAKPPKNKTTDKSEDEGDNAKSDQATTAPAAVQAIDGASTGQSGGKSDGRKSAKDKAAVAGKTSAVATVVDDAVAHPLNPALPTKQVTPSVDSQKASVTPITAKTSSATSAPDDPSAEAATGKANADEPAPAETDPIADSNTASVKGPVLKPAKTNAVADSSNVSADAASSDNPQDSTITAASDAIDDLASAGNIVPLQHDSTRSPATSIASTTAASPLVGDVGTSRSGVDTGPVRVAAAPPPPAPEAQFAQTNHASIVSGIRAQLLPGGGSMQMRLDPPDLGAMRVSVQMRDGVMSATFETSSDQATKLLSHSLGDLKTALESQGVSVEAIHVRQAPRSEDSQSSNQDSQRQQGQAGSGEDSPREQQRREMMQRLWKRLSGADPLDMVA